MKFESVTTDDAILACLPVLKQLRPTLVPDSFVAAVRRMAVGGYRLVALRDPDVVAVAGYRVIEMFATGRILYVDDLVTDEAVRSRGHGRAVLEWLAAEGEPANVQGEAGAPDRTQIGPRRWPGAHNLFYVNKYLRRPVVEATI